MLSQSISKNSLLLGLFALITAGVLATTQFYTKDRIIIAEEKAAMRALNEIVPLQRFDNDILNDTVAIPAHLLASINLKKPSFIHIARFKGKPIAAILPTIAPSGYSGAIHLMVGVNVDGSIAGVRALAHKETPGLGDKINLTKSDWILDFNGKNLTNPAEDKWFVKKDGGVFDQFTGATITPRVVTAQVKKALQFVRDNHALIFVRKLVPPVESSHE